MFCSSAEAIAPAHLRLAAEIGTALAARGWDLVSGGGSRSMMGALARAARAGGAHTLGVAPHQLGPLEDTDHDADELVLTDGMRDRKQRMDTAADAFVALPGGLGTLEELLEVWTARSLGLHRKPVVVCDPAGVYTPLRTFLAGLREQGFVRDAALAAVRWTTSVPAALDACRDAGPLPPPVAADLTEAAPGG